MIKPEVPTSKPPLGLLSCAAAFPSSLKIGHLMALQLPTFRKMFM